jgi:hypothetical protein
MLRTVGAERLDQMEAHDPRALAARRDLRRIHRVMGTRRILLNALDRTHATHGHALRILELGAGDGTLMLGVAKALAHTGLRARIALLDRQPCVSRSTINAYARIGWTVESTVMDVESWASSQQPDGCDVIVTTLFLHHFQTESLTRLLAAVAARCQIFIACEPRRGAIALMASRLVGLIGANAVTRTDAVLSVRAGFRDRELSRLWPNPRRWRANEYRAGMFSHCFHASRAPRDA